MLRCVASTNQSSWSDQLAWVEYAHNKSTSSAMGVPPFEASQEDGGLPTHPSPKLSGWPAGVAL